MCFRRSEIVFDAYWEYEARIQRIIQTARINACKCSAVIKRDVVYCDRQCRVQGFPPRSLGERKGQRMGKACREDSGAIDTRFRSRRIHF